MLLNLKLMIIKNNNPRIEPSFSFKNRIYRFIWYIIQDTLFKFSPRTFYNYRNFILKIFGAQIGTNTHINRKVKIWAPNNLVIGNEVGIGDNVNLYSMDKIQIDDYTVISEGAFICTGSHDYNSYNFQLFTKPIRIETKTWICAEVFLHPGVIISEGVVVGARSVVTKNLDEAWSVYAGNPVLKIKSRIKN